MWGVAYEIDDQEWKNSVMAHLDHREKGGYTQHSVQFYPRQADNGMPSEGVTGMIFKRNFIEEIKDFISEMGKLFFCHFIPNK